jgi:hypothetical protein
VCYRTTAVTSVQCRAASVLASIGVGVSLGPALTVQDSTDYSTGDVSGIVDVTDRVVLTFSSGIASPSSKLVVLGVAPAPSLTLTALTAGSLGAYEVSAATDQISLASVSRLVLVLVYRVGDTSPPLSKITLLLLCSVLLCSVLLCSVVFCVVFWCVLVCSGVFTLSLPPCILSLPLFASCVRLSTCVSLCAYASGV